MALTKRTHRINHEIAARAYNACHRLGYDCVAVISRRPTDPDNFLYLVIGATTNKYDQPEYAVWGMNTDMTDSDECLFSGDYRHPTLTSALSAAADRVEEGV